MTDTVHDAKRVANSPACSALIPRYRLCRFCSAPLERSFLDLGVSPLCQSHVTSAQLQQMEPFYPLHAFVCESCFLVQLEEFVAPESIFSEYAYFSSYSSSWVEHARLYADTMIARLQLGPRSLVMEVASNDGYLLQHFVQQAVPVLGVEPAANIARVAIERGIRSEVCFLGTETAQQLIAQYGLADLVVGNNVLAHVPRLNDFIVGLRTLLAPHGVLTLEFPHLLRLIEGNQFDTIYHEHFSYFSFVTVERILAKHGLKIFDVEELPTHGGSLRIHAGHQGAVPHATTERVPRLRTLERNDGFETPGRYEGFAAQAARTKRALLRFMIDAREVGARIAGYGAPGKGNTLLNYCGIRTDLLEFTVDANPYKQGKYTPGTRIPILHPASIRERRPDYVLILPWNLRDEIAREAAYIRDWGGRFVVGIPSLEVF